jgi:hypothetical protein
MPYVDSVDTVLIMTVEPGFGGQTFMEDMMPKVSVVMILAQVSCTLSQPCCSQILRSQTSTRWIPPTLCNANYIANSSHASSAYYGQSVHVCHRCIDVFFISPQVRYLRERCRELDIEVDGGVGLSTIQACADVCIKLNK